MSRLASVAALLLMQLKRPPAIAGCGFALVMAAIVANGLFLQPRQHPSPLVATRGPAAFTSRQAPAERDPLMLAVQDALKQLGYYSGPVDGIAGPQTAAAIHAFEAAAGRVPSDKPDPDLLAAIRASGSAPAVTASTAVAAPAAASVPVAAAPVAPAPPAKPGMMPASLGSDTEAKPSPADPLVAAVQNALAVSAYGPLSTDGVIGPETRAAIMRFQRDHNLPVTGEISDSLVVELRATGAMRDS